MNLLQEKIAFISDQAKKYLPDDGIEEKIQFAFEFAKKAHDGQIRHSGDPYILHPVEATIHLMSLHPDVASIQACLLHDVPEDTDVPLKEIDKIFGKEVTQLVAAMKKLGKIKYRGEERALENLKKMFMAMSKDIRVIFIKLCDRLHNMQTLHFHPKQEKIERIARETLLIYAPIAERLGIYTIKHQLEEICFKILHPQEYENVVSQLGQSAYVRERFIHESIKKLEDIMAKSNIKASISGRIKTPYSVFKKLQKHNTMNIQDIYDIFALRIVVSTKTDCYMVLGIIHEHFNPITKRFKDYIAVPKANNYQSIHTTVLGLARSLWDKPTEIQIRTEDMHNEAEFGIAAHFLYKDHGSKANKTVSMAWLQEMAKISKNYQTQEELLSSMTSDIFSDRIFLLTPKGDVRDLPAGSTPIDFAYRIHSDIGHRCIGAKVDDMIVPLHHELQNGDVVEILTRKDAVPNEYWLAFVKTENARSKIKTWFLSHAKEENMRKGKELLNKQLRKMGHSILDADLSLLSVYDGKNLLLSERELLLENAGNGSVAPLSIIKKALHPVTLPKETKKDPPTTEIKTANVIIAGEKNIMYRLASCCVPNISNRIIGYVTRGGIISIHSARCTMLRNLHAQRFLPARWDTAHTQKDTLSVHLLLKDQTGILHQILEVIDRLHVFICDIRTGHRNLEERTTETTITVENTNSETIKKLLGTLKSLPFVLEAQEEEKVDS